MKNFIQKSNKNENRNVGAIINRQNGITLIALVITIIVLIILAGVAINLTLGENGILKRTEQAREKQSEQEAKEKLELVLVNARIEKETNTSYNDNYLDSMLEAKGITVNENAVIVNNYNFLIDREQLIIIDSLGETQIKVTAEVHEYLGKNENDKYEASLLLVVESNSGLQSVKIQNPDGTTFEMETEQVKLGKDMTVELDEEYIVTVTTQDGNTETRKIAEKSEETISNVQELVAFRDKVNSGLTYEGKTVTLANDIDLSSVCGANVNGQEVSWEPISKYEENKTEYFKGTFDGNYNTINNLYINSVTGGQGLFGTLNGTISNVIIAENGNVLANNYSAAIVGTNNGTIRRCINNAKVEVTANGAAGIASSNNGIIEECVNNGHIINYGYNCAGICSYNLNGTIQNCYNTGRIEGNNTVGGITGNNGNAEGTQVSKVYNCYSRGIMTADANMGGVFGLASKNSYDVKNTYWLLGIGVTYGIGGLNTNTNATGVNENTLKTYASTLGDAWIADGKIKNESGEWVDNVDDEGNIIYINNGYPILKWQMEK